MRALQSAVFAAIVLAALAGAALAQEPCYDIDYIKARAEAAWPDAVMTVFDGASIVAIERGLLGIGADLPDAERTFLVIDIGGSVLRLVGLNGGCYEDHIDVDRTMFNRWIEGAPG